MNIVVEFNFRNAWLKQEGRCFRCGNTLDPDNVFYWLDQKKGHNEIYCEECGYKVIEENPDMEYTDERK